MFNVVNEKERKEIAKKIFEQYLDENFRKYNLIENHDTIRITTSKNNFINVDDYVIDFEDDNWIISKWSCSIESSIITNCSSEPDIIFSFKDLEPIRGVFKSKFACDEISFLSKQELTDTTVYRLDFVDFLSVLENESDENKALVKEYYGLYDEEYCEKFEDLKKDISDCMNCNWYEDMQAVVSAIITNIQMRNV